MGTSGTTHSGSGLTEKQEQFGRLIGQGLSNSEACRVVGINRRTGTRWRYGRTVRITGAQLTAVPTILRQEAPAPAPPDDGARTGLQAFLPPGFLRLSVLCQERSLGAGTTSRCSCQRVAGTEEALVPHIFLCRRAICGF